MHNQLTEKKMRKRLTLWRIHLEHSFSCVQSWLDVAVTFVDWEIESVLTMTTSLCSEVNG